MDALVGWPLAALAALMLAAGISAVLTTRRRRAWAVTAALLWSGAASFALLALVGGGIGDGVPPAPLMPVLLGWTLTVSGLLTGLFALAGPLPSRGELRPWRSPRAAGGPGSRTAAPPRRRAPVAASGRTR